MKISCIIPTCNRNEFLLEAVNSVLAQTFAADEIIIVNNGEEVVLLPEKLKNKALVYNIIPFAGVSQARNFGASVAGGDYIAFLDDDDLWNEKYLENVLKAIKEGEVCIISRLDKLLNNKISPFKNANGKLTISNILTYNPGITGSNIVISKDALFKVKGFDPKLPPSEDKAMILEILKAGIKVKILTDNQTIIRIHKDERLSSSSHKMAEGIYQFTRKYSNLMNKRQRFFNWSKIYKYRYQSGEKTALLSYFFTKTISLFLKVF